MKRVFYFDNYEDAGKELLTWPCLVGVGSDIVPSGDFEGDDKIVIKNKQYSLLGHSISEIDTLGIALMDTKHRLFTLQEYQNGLCYGTPMCIAVSDGTHRFGLGLETITGPNGESTGRCKWGGRGTTISNIVTTTSSSTAITDFKGKENTDQIIAQVTSSDNYFTNPPYSAAAMCKNYAFSDGVNGYLLSAGELQMVANNKSAILEFLNAIGNTSVKNALSYYVWSSTQYSSSNAWIYGFYYGGWGNGYKASDLCVVPVRALPL